MGPTVTVVSTSIDMAVDDDDDDDVMNNAASRGRRTPPKPTSSCRLLPHGWYTLLIATLAMMGWISSLFQDMCNFAQVSGPIVQQLIPTYTNVAAVPYLEFGFAAYRQPTPSTDPNGDNDNITYTVTISGNCTEYPNDAFMDPAWTTARAMNFLSLVVGGGGTVFVWCSTCFVFSKVTWRWTGYELLLASALQSLSFIWYLTQLCTWNTCTLSYGSKANVLASILWFGTGLMMVCRYPPPERPSHHPDDDDDDDDLDGTTTEDGIKYGETGIDHNDAVDDAIDAIDGQKSGQSTVERPTPTAAPSGVTPKKKQTRRSNQTASPLATVVGRGGTVSSSSSPTYVELTSQFPSAEIA